MQKTNYQKDLDNIIENIKRNSHPETSRINHPETTKISNSETTKISNSETTRINHPETTRISNSETMKNSHPELVSGSLTSKPTLLLHACCGPCSSYVIEYLSEFFDITIFYYNPNIYPPEEYNRRLNELKNLLPRFPVALKNNVKLVVSDYNQEDFYKAINIKEHPELAHEEEKGQRCHDCYQFRMKKAYEYACSNNFEWFSTTLSISPFKDSEKINVIGNELAAACHPDTKDIRHPELVSGSVPHHTKWLPSDFKKKGGFKRSLELSAEYGLYRQQYCGCVYSKTNTEKFRQEHPVK